MKTGFAIISAVSVWIYAILDAIKNILEPIILQRYIESMVSFSREDIVVNITACQHILLIVTVVTFFLFLADNLISFVDKRKKNRVP